jgi:hypothetical protein
MNSDFRNRPKINSSTPSNKIPSEPQNLQATGAGIYWSGSENALYRKIGEKFILYSRDRRKQKGINPGGPERRQQKVS